MEPLQHENVWVRSIIIVNFDESHGQVIQCIYPTNSVWQIAVQLYV